MASETLTRDLQGVQAPPVGTYEIDAPHSAVSFVAKHMMFTRVRGHFTDFSGTIEVGETPEASSAEVRIKADSLTTGNEMRDNHLRSQDFFEIERWPDIVFKTTKVDWTGGTTLRVEGELTVRDVTRPVVLEAEYEGTIADMRSGEPRIAFSARTELDREDWGITWNVALETGGVLVGKRVQIELEIAAVKVAAEGRKVA